jgi:hypothetical protein
MRKVKRKRSLNEASYNLGRGKVAPEIIPPEAIPQKAPPQERPAAAAASAIRSLLTPSKETTPETKVEYDSPDDVEKKFTQAGFPKLARIAVLELNDLFDVNKDIDNEHINDLIVERDKLSHAMGKLVQEGGYEVDDRYEFDDPRVETQFKDLEKQVEAKQKEISALVKKATSILEPEIKKFEALKKGDKTVISNFMEEIKNSPNKQRVGLKVNAVLELQDKGFINQQEVKKFVDFLKTKKLLERKLYIKLADILF